MTEESPCIGGSISGFMADSAGVGQEVFSVLVGCGVGIKGLGRAGLGDRPVTQLFFLHRAQKTPRAPQT